MATALIHRRQASSESRTLLAPVRSGYAPSRGFYTVFINLAARVNKPYQPLRASDSAAEAFDAEYTLLMTGAKRPSKQHSRCKHQPVIICVELRSGDLHTATENHG